MSIQYKNISQSELRDLVIKLELHPYDKFSIVYKDFHYFSRYDINSFNDDVIEFIIAIDTDTNNIVGVLKHSLEISKFNHCDDIQRDDPYTLMRYIDVKKGYKGLGIGTQMIKKFNEQIDKTIPLLISEESDDGKIIGSHNMFQKYMDNVVIVLRELCGTKTVNKKY